MNQDTLFSNIDYERRIMTAVKGYQQGRRRGRARQGQRGSAPLGGYGRKPHGKHIRFF